MPHHMKDFSRYEVTGIDRGGKRFKLSYINYWVANSINLWNGTLWGITHEGKRRLLKRVH